jgi:hypothetical protein
MAVSCSWYFGNLNLDLPFHQVSPQMAEPILQRAWKRMTRFMINRRKAKAILTGGFAGRAVPS